MPSVTTVEEAQEYLMQVVPAETFNISYVAWYWGHFKNGPLKKLEGQYRIFSATTSDDYYGATMQEVVDKFLAALPILDVPKAELINFDNEILEVPCQQ